LIACANVANLLLAWANSRQKEMAIRSALGACPGRIFRQFLTESILLALMGGALGLLLAFWVIRFLPTVPSLAIPRLEEIGLDIRVLGFTLAVSLITGVLFGLAPAFQASKADVNDMLKENIRSSSGGPHQIQTRRLLVFAEIFLAQVLLITAGLLIKSLWSYQQIHPGFKAEGVLSVQVWLPSYYYPQEQQMAAFYSQVLARLAVSPGVVSVGAISTLPLSGSNISWRYTIDGRPPAQPGEVLRANFRTVSADYFRTMGIALLAGRVFTDLDHENAAGVVLINESMARRYWPAQNPLGRHLTIPSAGGISREIVGVVADVRHTGLDTESGEEMYVPYRQKPLSFMALVVRTAADPLRLLPVVRSEILAVDRNLPVYQVKTLEQLLAESTSTPRLNALLLGVFAVLALLLAAVGIYGVLSYSIGQSRHEIGIRQALGARRGHILHLVVGPAVATALWGIACGLFAALALSKVLAHVLFQVNATDAGIYAATALLLISVALIASLVPAYRSLRVPLMDLLRYR
jgi:putative ABC transport system permease protein